MLHLIARRARARSQPLAVFLAGAVAAMLLAALELGRLHADLADERLYQSREVQEGLAGLYRDLQMVNHLITLPVGEAYDEAQDFVGARRDQLVCVRWLGHLQGADSRPEALLASSEMLGYDPRRDPAVAALLTERRESGVTAINPHGLHNSASMALVLGSAEGEPSALVALVDGNQLLDDSLNALNRATAPFTLVFEGKPVGRWPHFNQREGDLTIAESRQFSVGQLDFTIEFATAPAATVAGQVVPLPAIVLFAAVAVATIMARGNPGTPPAAPAPPPPPAPRPARDLHRACLWRMGELAASLAHDLGQPLNVIRLTAEAAQDAHVHGRLDGERLTRALAHAVDQSMRAQGMIDALVAVTRRPGRPAVPLHPVELVRRVLGRNLARLAGQGVRLRWHADLSVPPVAGHAARLEAAIQHALTNACEALAARPAECGTAATLWVTCRRDGDGVAIEVADNGPGFPRDLLPLIDDPMAAAPERGKGCGLGLTLILGVAEEMGGRLSVADAGPGTRITLQLPPMRRSLLLVEDDVAAAEALAGALSGRGWQVRVAHGGNPALALFRAEPADAVITDLHMTDGDGWQLIERLRALSPDLPILAISTYDGCDAQRAVTCGAAVVLRKPLSLQDVCEELDGLFDGSF